MTNVTAAADRREGGPPVAVRTLVLPVADQTQDLLAEVRIPGALPGRDPSYDVPGGRSDTILRAVGVRRGAAALSLAWAARSNSAADPV